MGIQELEIEQLFNLAMQDLDPLLAEGHTERLEHRLRLIHLGWAEINPVPDRDCTALLSRVAALARRCYAVGTNDLAAPLQSDVASSFVCSYPRSGITVAIRLAASVLQGQVFSGIPQSMRPFSKKIYPRSYPYVRVIKDHVARPFYADDRVSLIMRDGRDAMVSLAYMTMRQGRHRFDKRGDLAKFIRWLDESHPFGGWARHMRDVARLLRNPSEKHVMRYEDFMVGPQPFLDFVRFLDPKHCLDDDDLVRTYRARSSVFETIRNDPQDNKLWGIGDEFEPDSLFYEWSRNRQRSSWRQSWDAAARKAFHETGATEFLIEYGYESDPDWWRD